MRANCHKHYLWGYLGKPLLAALAVMISSNLSALAQSSPLTQDGELLSLYRELKLVESESLRVAVTIDALEKELHEYPNPENLEQLHSQLGHLYKYDVQLYSHYRDLNKVWSYLQNPDRKSVLTIFNADQSKPIPKIREGAYQGLPDDAIPITDFTPINIEYIYTDLIHPKSDPAPPVRGELLFFQ
jgi:hypothetical protein